MALSPNEGLKHHEMVGMTRIPYCVGMALSPNEGLKQDREQPMRATRFVGMALSPNEGLKLAN